MVGVLVGLFEGVFVGVNVGEFVDVRVGVGVGVAVLVGVRVKVGLFVDVGVQPITVVVTGLEFTPNWGVPLSASAVLIRLTPQLLIVPTRVRAPAAPPTRFPKVQTTFCPATAGEPLEEE